MQISKKTKIRVGSLIFFLSLISLCVTVYYFKRDAEAKAHVSEGLIHSSDVQMKAVYYYVEHKKWPEDRFKAGAQNYLIGRAVDRVTFRRTNDTSQGIGIITIQFNEKLDNATLVLAGRMINGQITWGCYAEGAKTPAGVTAGTVPAKYTPGNCR